MAIPMQRSYPPPPPTGPGGPPPPRGIHGPRTSFFLTVRARLASMEGFSSLPAGKSLGRGLLVSLILAASLGFGLSFIIELALLPSIGGDAMTAVLAPLIEEPSKALAIILVAYLMWKIVPNSRYGATLGAAAGLGFGVVESIIYIIGFALSGSGEAITTRIIVTPLMHPLWSAFVGIGVFALVESGRPSRPDVPKSPVWIPFLFLLLGIVNHMIWNSIVVALATLGYLPIILDIIFVFPIFALILRDFLGGHFNFQNFLEPLAEPTTLPPVMPPPPPPPPPQ